MIENQRTKIIGILLVLLGAVVLLLVLYVAYGYLPRQGTITPVSVSSTTPQTVDQVPPPSATVRQQLEVSHGFQAFVSIADSGFMSATTTIKAGQTIRFANSASHDVWIGQITGTNTPSNPDTSVCSGPLAVCHALHSGDFVELTFPTKGTFYYMDDLNPTMRGSVVVQ